MKTSGKKIKKMVVVGALVIVVAGLLSYGVRTIIQLVTTNRMLASQEKADSQALRDAERKFEHDLALANQENMNLNQGLRDAQNQNNAIASQVQQISGTVGTLQQLSQTDPQLLEKYSRVYFLNENYIPKSLSPVDATFLFDTNKPQQFLTQALPFLTNMIIAANNAGVTLQVASAYRSFGTQSALKSTYTITYGSGANSFSAEQGYSEHQLGTAVDFAMHGVTLLTLRFASSTGYAWLGANAYKYGFELSYPPHNPYYIYEPWHWRFVGIALATWLYQQNITFYDAPQRTINTYLVSLFDQ